MNLLYLAKQFATMHHVLLHRQLYGPVPYTHHLAEVEAVLREFGYPEALYVVAWLHDVREDCGVSRKELAEAFGDEMATLVDALTDDAGPNRAARKAGSYDRMRAAPAAIPVKLADRIANIRAGVASGSGLVTMYRTEFDSFYRNLYVVGMHEPMWTEIAARLGVERPRFDYLIGSE
jgi:(p)ppGpp synthase/HD superfamily hydrolase